MRMWIINPKWLCRKHLLGEHYELHKLVGSINKGKSIDGYIEKGLVDTSQIKERHDILVDEMERRGYKHKSPMEYDDKISRGHVDRKASLKELFVRCKDCYKRIIQKK